MLNISFGKELYFCVYNWYKVGESKKPIFKQFYTQSEKHVELGITVSIKVKGIKEPFKICCQFDSKSNTTIPFVPVYESRKRTKQLQTILDYLNGKRFQAKIARSFFTQQG